MHTRLRQALSPDPRLKNICYRHGGVVYFAVPGLHQRTLATDGLAATRPPQVRPLVRAVVVVVVMVGETRSSL